MSERIADNPDRKYFLRKDYFENFPQISLFEIAEKIENDEQKIGVSNEITLRNGDKIQLVEFMSKQPVPEVREGGGIQILKKPKPNKSYTAFLMDEERRYVGHLSANQEVDSDSASLDVLRLLPAMTKILPLHLREIYGEIVDNPTALIDALYINDSFRGRKKATELLCLLFSYLQQQGVKTVLIRSISDEGRPVYKSTGAKLGEDGKVGVYEDIGTVLWKYKGFVNDLLLPAGVGANK